MGIDRGAGAGKLPCGALVAVERGTDDSAGVSGHAHTVLDHSLGQDRSVGRSRVVTVQI